MKRAIIDLQPKAYGHHATVFVDSIAGWTVQSGYTELYLHTGHILQVKDQPADIIDAIEIAESH